MARPTEHNGGDRLPQDADERAARVLESVMGIAAEIALDLDITWSYAREMFARTLFDRAERRFSSAPRIAAALDTSLRTVKQYRQRRREDDDEPPPPTFNMRRRVLHVLDQRPATIEDLEREVPVGSDVNYARSAIHSLIEDDLVVKGKDGKLRKSSDAFVPWYLRAEVFGARAFALFCDHFARLVGSRLTPRAEQAGLPAAIGALVSNIPADEVQGYVDELLEVLGDFDRRWQARATAADSDRPRVMAGAVVAFGELGPPMPDAEARELQDVEPNALRVGEGVLPTYRRYLARENAGDGVSPSEPGDAARGDENASDED